MRNPAHRTVLSVLLLATALCSGAAMAAEDCRDRIPALLELAYPGAQGETGDDGDMLRLSGTPIRWADYGKVVCKVWPASPDKTLIAVKLQYGRGGDEAVDEADLEVLVVDTARDRIVQRHLDKGLLGSDAIRMSSLAFDTARYRLDDTTTAFGLRIGRSGSSRANPYEASTLRLYVLDGEALRPVLSNLIVTRNSGEWDTNCAGQFTDTRRTLAVDKQRDNGYAGLLVSSVDWITRNVGNSEDCDEVKGGKKTSSVRLRYDGRRYVVPEGLRGFDDDYPGR